MTTKRFGTGAGDFVWKSGTGSGDSSSDPFIETVNPGSVATLPTTVLMARAAISTASSGDNTIVGAVALQTIRIHKLIISYVASPVTLLFKDGASTTLLTAPMNTYGSIVLDFDGEPWFITTAGNAFIINLSAAVQIYGRAYYTQSA